MSQLVFTQPRPAADIRGEKNQPRTIRAVPQGVVE
jgi:hypothetical protein